MNDKIKFEVIILSKEQLKIFQNNHNELNQFVESKIEHLNHGDVVLISSTSLESDRSKHLSETKFHLLCEIADPNNKNSKFLCDLSHTTNGDQCIPLEISKSVYKKNPNFIRDYLKLYERSFNIYKHTYKAVELDFKEHSALLTNTINLKNEKLNGSIAKLYFYFEKDNNNNKNADFESNFYVSFLNQKKLNANNQCDQQMMNLLASNFDNIEFDSENTDEMNEETESLNSTSEFRENLIDHENNASKVEIIIDEKDRDPELEEFAEQFRKVYENEFRDYLKTLKKNETIYATALPTKKYCKDTYDEDSANSTTLMFYFDTLETDENGNINAVVVTTFDRSQSCHFTPSICNDYGPYFQTQLYTCLYNIGRTSNSQTENFFLDLPVGLYNLLE